MGEYQAIGIAVQKGFVKVEAIRAEDRLNSNANIKHMSGSRGILSPPWKLEDKDARCPFRVQSVGVVGLTRIVAEV